MTHRDQEVTAPHYRNSSNRLPQESANLGEMLAGKDGDVEGKPHHRAIEGAGSQILHTGRMQILNLTPS